MNLKNYNTNNTLVHHFLEESAKRFSNKIALIYKDKRLTYSTINNLANQFADFLIKKGIQPGYRAVIICENSDQYVISYYGILKTGAIAVPLSTDLKTEKFGKLISEIDPFAIICSKKFLRLISARFPKMFKKYILIVTNDAIEKNQNLKTVFSLSNAISKGSKEDIGLKINQNSIASIIYTSGSTGTPKGVMLSHKNLVTNTDSIIQFLELTENDKQMVVLPFFYVMGKSLLNTHFAVGGTIVINNQFMYTANVLNQMIEEEVTGFSGVPSTYAYLLHRSPLEKYKKKLTKLRYCSQAGGHMANSIKRKLRNILPVHTKIFIMYGATEASARLTYLKPEKYFMKIGSIGKPIKGVTLKIVDEKGKEVKRGRNGELVASGDNIMLGYWNERKKSSVLSGCGYHTGDIAYQDEDGYFYITGRKDNIIKVGGHKINPFEIEEALMATNIIVECAVISIPDELLGNKIVAVVVPKENEINKELIYSEIAKKISKIMIPSDIKFVRNLPKKSSGKIDREGCYKLID